MKFSITEPMLWGENIEQKLNNIQNLGFKGVELFFYEKEYKDVKEKVFKIKKNLKNTSLKPVSMIWLHKYMQNLCSSEKELREKCISNTKLSIQMASELGSRTAIGPEYSAVDPLPLFNFYDPTFRDRYEILIDQLKKLSNFAEKEGTGIDIEPINRYESRFYNTVSDALKICKEIKSISLGIIIDFFHANIEEANIAASIFNARDYLKHIHLGDNNRWLPGYGSMDFVSAFKSLVSIGYSGYFSFECGIPGDPQKELKKSMNYLEACYEIASRKITNFKKGDTGIWID